MLEGAPDRAAEPCNKEEKKKERTVDVLEVHRAGIP